MYSILFYYDSTVLLNYTNTLTTVYKPDTSFCEQVH